MNNFKISVSVLNMDFSSLKESVREIETAGADSLHLDIMDGHFVDNISFGPGVSKDIIGASSVPVHAHLMIEQPSAYVEKFFAAGAASVTVHAETINENNKNILDRPQMGVSLNPDVPLAALHPYLEKVERILLMSVNAGFGGQKFIEKSISRIRDLSREREKTGGKYIIEVDGGINASTGLKCVKAGADVLIVGSWVTVSDNPAGRIRKLRNIG